MKQIIFLLIFILFFNSVYAVCTSGQIDINSASLSELDKLEGIGEVKAQAIIDGRNYNSLDDLINVKGIGEATLSKIKTQNLACVMDEENSENVIEKSETIMHNENIDPISDRQEDLTQTNSDFVEENSPQVSLTVQNESIINLNQDIKIEQNKPTIYESKTEKIRKYSIYGFAFFLIFLIIVLLIKN